ncbi:MAG: hypothetical protein GQ569_12635 [Methylococcaceae bacterium]|nr:hypothetical protein [Methylococcaceae bacterium]
MKLFKIIRILILLLLLASVAFYSKTQKLKSQSWASPLNVVIYPLNADNSPEVADYISGLKEDDFIEIDDFFQRQSKNYSIVTPQPTLTTLGQTLTDHFPPTPTPNSSPLEIIWWGLKFRYWAFRYTPDSESNHHRVRVFLHYHKADDNSVLQHSLGMDKGLLAIVHAFGDKRQQAQNNIIIAHELLHTVGATDKYGANNQPAFPEGYANPDKTPLHPQKKAEIMSARIPLTVTKSVMAETLKQCVINQQTAKEINWSAL